MAVAPAIVKIIPTVSLLGLSWPAVATIRQRRPGVWEVRVFTGRDEKGRPTQTSRTVRGTKRDAEAVAASLTVTPPGRSARRTVSDALEAWLDANEATWAASSKRDARNRARLVLADRIAQLSLARLSVADVERWHAWLRSAGVGEASIRNQHYTLRAALMQAMRWGWVTVNVAALARLAQPRRKPRAGMSVDDVRAVLVAAASIDAAAELALRIAAATGPRRSELAALRWDDLTDDHRLLIDGAVEVIRHADERRTLVDAAAKTANVRAVALDEETIARIEGLAAERREYGPWMFAIGDEPAHPDRIGYWWRRARAVRHRLLVATARPPALVGDGWHQPWARRPNGRRSPRAREPGDDLAGVCARGRRSRRGRRRHAGLCSERRRVSPLAFATKTRRPTR